LSNLTGTDFFLFFPMLDAPPRFTPPFFIRTCPNLSRLHIRPAVGGCGGGGLGVGCVFFARPVRAYILSRLWTLPVITTSFLAAAALVKIHNPPSFPAFGLLFERGCSRACFGIRWRRDLHTYSHLFPMASSLESLFFLFISPSPFA